MKRLIDEAEKSVENVFFRDFDPDITLDQADAHWYFDRDDRKRIVQYLEDNHLWDEGEARDLLEHKFSFFTLNKKFVGEQISWHRDYKNDRQSPLTYGKRIDYRDYEVVGNFKYIWEINRHQHLITLAKAYYMTGEEVYRLEVERQISSWIDQNPYMHGLNWTSSLELAVRLISWSWIWMFLGDIETRFKEKWLQSIYKHCLFISKNISAYSSANNHLIGEVSGLFIASIVWPFKKDAETWRAMAYEALVREMEEQNYDDGVNKEQAISYQQFVLDFFLLAGLIGQKNSISFPQAYWQRAEQMLVFVASIMDQNGNVPRIGDADDGYAVVLSEHQRMQPFRSLLATGAVLFRNGGFKAQINEFDEKSLWLLGPAGSDEFNQVSPEKFVAKRDFKNGGYYILGSNSDSKKEVKGIFDCGPLGYLSISAHGHADALSLTLSVDGNEILVDPGTFIYQGSTEWRDYFKGTSAHNTLRVDGENQSEIGGSFMWLRKANARLISWDTNRYFDRIVAEHDGYKRLPDPVVHRREVLFDKSDNVFRLRDILTARGSHEVECFFHFAWQCNVEQSDVDCWTIENNGTRVKLRVDPALKFELFRGNAEPILGWESYSFEQKVETFTLRGFGTVNGDACFVSELLIK